MEWTRITCIGVKGCIEGAVRVKPGDAVSGDAANGGKITPYQDLTVRLHRDGMDNVICIGVKGGIEGAVRVKPGYAVSGDAANGGENTPYQDLTVRLHRDGLDRRHLHWG